ncbi:MAG: bifunctional 4-hydroxy-2-oxoglutarate aldolase/2-dehydro-3-deoxy-phosphogluconate aldolase [Acidimicrobiia bacterium]
MAHPASLDERLPSLGNIPIIGILRRCPSDRIVKVAGCAARSGLTTIEITFDSDDPTIQIRSILGAFPELTVGAGTILDTRQAEAAIGAGASFLVSPVVSAAVLSTCLEVDLPYLPGAATPTEIWSAYEAGATAVKVFPARELGGPAYLAALRAPLEGIPLVATGGIGLDDIPRYLAAGAAAVGLGGTLFPRDFIENGLFSEISDLVSRAVEIAG